MSDDITRLCAIIDSYLVDYQAQGIDALINAGGDTNNIDDGSVPGGSYPGQNPNGDGRQLVTGLEVQNLKAALVQVQTALETTVITGVGTTPKTVAAGIQVNGSVR
jgi:hypothetical protein